jgi:tetratricopeptide (TPR) repeat protein
MNSLAAALFLAPLAVTAFAGPREDFKAAVAAVQSAPADKALREKVIGLAQKIKPAPAVPAEARKPFVMAATFQKEAKKPADYVLAADSYREALRLAPWWGDAYYNLSVALESAGRLGEAKDALALYLLTKPKDAQAAEERLFALEAKEKMAAAAAEQAKRSVRGRWDNGMFAFEIVGEEGALRLVEGPFYMRKDRQWQASQVVVGSDRVSFGLNQSDCPQCFTRCDLKLSDSGDEMSLVTTSLDGSTFQSSPLKRK